MDCESDCGEVLEDKTSPDDNKHVRFSPRVKVMNTDHKGGSGPCSETTVKEIEHGSFKSSDSSDAVSSSSSKASSEDIVHGNPQILSESIRENNIAEPTGGSNRLEESITECPESTSQLSDVNHACLVECMSPTLSLSTEVAECPEGYDPYSPAYSFNQCSTTMEGNITPDDLLFSIHVGDSSFSSDDATRMGTELNKSGELLKSGQSFSSEELCQSEEPSKSSELCQSGESYKTGESHKLKDCQSTEFLKASDLKGSGELVRFHQTSPTTNVVEPNKELAMEKITSVDVKHGEKGMVGEPISEAPKALVNNQVDTNIGDSRVNGSKHQLDRPVPK